MSSTAVRLCLLTRNADARYTPLALMCLKAAAREWAGLPDDDAPLLEFPPSVSPEEMATQALAARPDVLALSCYVWNLEALMAVAAIVRRSSPRTRIVVGGPEVGPIPDATLAAYPDVDVVVRDEGERPLADLLMAWRAGGDLRGVAGISYRESGVVVANPDGPIADVNTLPPSRDTADVPRSRRIACVETQRGCVFRCSFCFYNKGLSIRNRRFSIERVEADLRYWLAQDIDELYFMDPVFNLNAERAKTICRLLATLNTRRLPLSAEVWAEFIDDELADLMVAAGFRALEVGLQSTQQQTLDAVDRRLRVAPFIAGVRALQSRQIRCEVQLILGLPHDTLETFREAIDFAASLEPDQLAAFRLLVLPGTELYNDAGRLGLTFDARPPHEVQSTSTMTRDEIAHGWEMALAVRTLWRSRTVRWLSKERGVTFSAITEHWAGWTRTHPEAALAKLPRTRRPDAPMASETAAALPGFIDAFCRAHAIDPAFFVAAARRECLNN